jgi:hypothetical protein
LHHPDEVSLGLDFLADKPVFGAMADEFLLFVGHVPLVRRL